MNYSEKIGNVNVSIVMGDITRTKVDAFIVPEFDSDVSYGGVGGAVARAGAVKGMEAYRDFVEAKGKQNFGDVLLTQSGGGNSEYLLHVVSVGSDREEEFDTVQKAVINALSVAAEKNIRSVAAPALGTGIIGKLSDAQSAAAMLKAIAGHSGFSKTIDSISIVIYNDQAAFNAFKQALSSKSYMRTAPGPGQRPLDAVRWLVTRQAEYAADKVAGLDEKIAELRR